MLVLGGSLSGSEAGDGEDGGDGLEEHVEDVLSGCERREESVRCEACGEVKAEVL